MDKKKQRSGKITAVNSKAAVGSFKVSLGSLPSAAIIHGAVAAKVGNDKYGFYNYRDSQVSFMMYLDAIERHRLALLDGEDYSTEKDEDGNEYQVHHAGFIIAGAGILLDAIERGNLIDDRPPRGAAAETMARFASEKAHRGKKISKKTRESYLAEKRRSYQR